jgi:hypothetical protein
MLINLRKVNPRPFLAIRAGGEEWKAKLVDGASLHPPISPILPRVYLFLCYNISRQSDKEKNL